MSLRRAIVEADVAGLNVTEFCRVHGVSTWFFYDLRRRYAEVGDAALEPRSRAPHRVANRTSADVEDRVVAIRKELVDLGLDAGPASIRDRLGSRPDQSQPRPSEATIWRILSRRGFIDPQPAKAPRRQTRRFQAERVNERWQIDATHWPLADGTPADIIDIIDDCSRLAVESRAVASCTAAAALDAMANGAAKWGWPAGILSDNGSPFRGQARSGRAGGLAAALAALGIRADHSRPYHPQTCGKVERFHQTLKRCLTAQGPAHTINELQAHIDAFVEIYNTQRPHRALARRTPADVWHTTPRSGPANHPLGTPTAIYHSTVTNGCIWAGRHLRITVGAAHNGRHTTIVLTGPACHVFADSHLIRHLTIDPTRRDQPLNQQPPTVSNAPRHP
jgi:transposase InsO family protein